MMNITNEYLTQRLRFAEERFEESKAGVNFWAGQCALLRELLDTPAEVPATTDNNNANGAGAATAGDGTDSTT